MMSHNNPSLNHVENNSQSSAMSDQTTATKKVRRPYQAPAFIVSKAFERQALSCAGCLNQSSSWPSFCGMRS